MNPILTLGIALLVLVFHTWASYRSPRFWYLGGIVPLLWVCILAYLWYHGQIDVLADWKILLFPTLLLLLIWLRGNLTAKKREMECMQAKDL